MCTHSRCQEYGVWIGSMIKNRGRLLVAAAKDVQTRKNRAGMGQRSEYHPQNRAAVRLLIDLFVL